MRVLTEEEAAKIPSKPIGKHSRARIILLKMKPGEVILLEKSDWNRKYKSPSELISRMRKTDKVDFTIETALDGSGWIIRRVK